MRKVLLAALLAPLCEAARSTWSAEMAEGKDTACFQKPAPASAAAAAGADAEPAGACAGRVCVEKLKRASAARHAGHFCGNRWCAAVPQAAACVGGCPIELPRYDKHMPNLLPIELLQPMPYGEAWVYGCARKDGAGEPDSCGGGERARDVHSALEELRYLDEHAKGKSGAVSCACNQRKKQSKRDDDRHMVIVLTDIGWEMAVAAEWGGLGLPRLTAAREELFDAAPYLVATGEDWALLTSLTPSSVRAGSAQQKALLAVQTALRAPSGSGVRPLIETEASAERRTSIFSRALLGGDGSSDEGSGENEETEDSSEDDEEAEEGGGLASLPQLGALCTRIEFEKTRLSPGFHLASVPMSPTRSSMPRARSSAAAPSSAASSAGQRGVPGGGAQPGASPEAGQAAW